MNGTIYVIENRLDGKRYIGQALCFAKRLRAHLYAARKDEQLHLYRAMRKYGQDQFSIRPLICGIRSKTELDHLEKLWIRKFRSSDARFGYNMTAGGEGCIGLKPSAETRRKMSQARKRPIDPMKGKSHTKDTKRKMRFARLGKHPTEETKRKMSASAKVKIFLPQQLEALRRYHKIAVEKAAALKRGKPFCGKAWKFGRRIRTRNTAQLALWSFVLCLFSLTAEASVSISANLQNLGVQNVTASGTFVRFTLRNYGAQIPRVSGTSIIVKEDQDFTPDASGNISGTLYGNNEITPNGTFYQVCVWYQNRQFRCNSYIINPPSFNLNTATPMSTGAPLSATTQVTQSFAFTQTPAATTWTILHNFGTQQVIVEFFDVNGKLIFPDTVTLTDVNTVTATFVTAQAGSATVLRVSNINIVSPTSGVVLTNPTTNQAVAGGFDVANVGGGSFTATKFVSASANVALTGVHRLSSTDTGPCWRNAGNTADLCFSKNASDALLFNGVAFAVGTVTTFTAGNFSPLFTTSVATASTTPALTFTTVNQNANLFYGGPSSGGAAAPSFRLLVPADYPVFVASGSSHAAGAVPDPGASAGTTRYLREDSTWVAGTGTGTPVLATSPSLTTPKIGGGSTITRWNVITSSSLTWSVIGIGATSSQSQTITGVQAADQCVPIAWGQVMGGSGTSAFLVSIRVTGTNTVVFDWVNPFGSTQTPVTGTVTLLCLQ